MQRMTCRSGTLSMHHPAGKDLLRQNAPMDLTGRIIHQDERLIGVDKPSGMASVPGGPDPSLLDLVAAHLEAPVFTVHRLDRGTSGIIVFARDRAEHRRLSLLFESHEVRKSYLAAVHGHLDDAEGLMDLPLRAFGSGRVGVASDGKPARTRYRLRERLANADLLDVMPETGRRHQIRVHLNALGHPVLGDPVYGPPPRPVGGIGRLMLHALELELPGPDGRPLRLRAEPGADFEDALEALRG